MNALTHLCAAALLASVAGCPQRPGGSEHPTPAPQAVNEAGHAATGAPGKSRPERRPPAGADRDAGNEPTQPKPSPPKPTEPKPPPVPTPTPRPSDDAGVACELACDPPQHCELVSVQCIRAPCPAQPRCVGGDKDCDPRKVTCKRTAPACGEGQAPSVQDGCYADCVALERCACTQAEQCPNPDTGTCHLFARHCGPYVE